MEIEEAENKKVEVYPKSHVIVHHKSIPYMPSPITCLKSDANQQLLAIGKQSGIIEIVNYPSFMHVSLHASINSPVKKIFWISQSEIIAFYLSGQISIFTIHDHRPIDSYQLPTNINIFDASQIDENSFVIGCSEGTLRKIEINNYKLFQTQQTVQLDFICLSVANNQDIVYGSFSNGQIRSYQIKNLNLISTWSINISQTQIGQNKVIFPWKLCLCNDHLLVGTSNGSILIFETQFNTEMQKIRTHEADIQCMLAVDNNVYISGVDSKVVILTYQLGQYSESGHERGQSHDIQAIEMLKQQKLVSAGINTDLCLYQLDQNGVFQNNKCSHRFTIPQPQNFQINSQFLAVNHFNTIDIVKYSLQNELQYHCQFQLSNPCHFIKLNQRMFCYAQQDQTFIYRMDTDNQFKKIRILPYCKNLVFLNQQNQFFIIDKDDKLKQYNLRGAYKFRYQLPKGQSTIMQIINKRFLIICYPVLQKIISIRLNDFEVQEIDCSLNQNMVTNISIIKGRISSILVNYASQLATVYIYDFKEQTWKLSKFSKEYMFQNPLNYKQLKDPIKGVIADPSDPKKLLMFSNNHIVKFHLRGLLPKECISTNLNEIQQEIKQKGKQNQNSQVKEVRGIENCQIIYNGNLMLNVLKLKQNEFLMIEWDKETTFQGLPDAFDAKKYKK